MSNADANDAAAESAAQEVLQIGKQLEQARARRDEHIMAGINDYGRSGYHMAKAAGLTEQAVTRIRKRSETARRAQVASELRKSDTS